MDQSPVERKPRNSLELPGTGLPNIHDSPAQSMGRKSKACSRKLQLKFRHQSMHQKTPRANDMVGKYAPVSDLVQSFQISEEPRHIIRQDQKINPSKSPSQTKLIDNKRFMTPDGEGMDAIHEHEDESMSRSNFSPDEFGDESLRDSISKSVNSPNTLMPPPDLRVQS